MEEKECLRCLKSHKEDGDMCSECHNLLEEAFNLIQNDPKVLKYYEYVEKQQEKAQVRLKRLIRIYDNGDTRLNAVLKSTGKGIKKIYKLNALDAGASAVKKIFSKDRLEDEPTDEERLLEEIVELENFVEMPPIEFVIYEYLVPEEQKIAVTEEKKKDSKVMVYKELYNRLIIDKFSKLDKGKQTKLILGIVVITAIAMIIVSFI